MFEITDGSLKLVDFFYVGIQCLFGKIQIKSLASDVIMGTGFGNCIRESKGHCDLFGFQLQPGVQLRPFLSSL